MKNIISALIQLSFILLCILWLFQGIIWAQYAYLIICSLGLLVGIVGTLTFLVNSGNVDYLTEVNKRVKHTEIQLIMFYIRAAIEIPLLVIYSPILYPIIAMLLCVFMNSFLGVRMKQAFRKNGLDI